VNVTVISGATFCTNGFNCGTILEGTLDQGPKRDL